MNTLELIGRSEPLFAPDISAHEAELSAMVSASNVLVISETGSVRLRQIKDEM